MRDTFVKSLYELFKSDPNIMLLTADLGYSIFEIFEINFPSRYINVGIAEQNMIGVASGLALEGKKIFVYSIGNFATLRCLEQIRNDACYHNLNINIISSGGGFSYGGLGMSHHATEDLSIMRALPSIDVIAPSTTYEVDMAIKELVNKDKVGYLRLDKSKVDYTDKNADISSFGTATVLREGSDITLISAGGIAEESIMAADQLSKEGIECRVLSMYSLKPIDVESIKKASEETRGIVTIEENVLIGGLGSAVAEVCMDMRLDLEYFKRIGIKDKYSSIVGSQDFLREYYCINSLSIVSYIRSFFKNRPS
jgi:transketolase